MSNNHSALIGKIVPTVFLLTLFAGLPPLAEGGEFWWPTEVVDGVPGVADSWYALGHPDGRPAEWIVSEASATFSLFAGGESYDPVVLSAALGVSPEVLAEAEVISFDLGGLVFEQSTWTFTSGGLTRVINAPEDALATGVLTETEYGELFGIEGLTGPGFDFHFVLLDLGPLFGQATDFSVEVQGNGNTPYGRPELDAIGLLCTEVVAIENTSLSKVKALYR